MLQEVVTGTSVIYWMMIMVGSVGVLSKIVNQITLQGMVKAAGNMQKSTHKLIKLVRSKYEHACMLHERVENVEAFVEKYIYEYKGIMFRIHTWRQLQIQTIWFSGILGFIGASSWFMKTGFSEEVYRYITLTAAEMMLLFVVSQLSDEQHKMLRVRNYMVDYLENVCAFRHKRIRQAEKERIDVIHPETGQMRAGQMDVAQGRTSMAEYDQNVINTAESGQGRLVQSEFGQRRTGQAEGRKGRTARQECRQGCAKPSDNIQGHLKLAESTEVKSAQDPGQEADQDLSISIEGEPRKAGKGDLAKKVFGRQERESEESLSSVQEEAIRRILEEFLTE